MPERSATAVTLHGLGDEYLTLAQLEAYSKISGRQLRNHLALPPRQALPCYRPGRKVLVRRSEFDDLSAVPRDARGIRVSRRRGAYRVVS